MQLTGDIDKMVRLHNMLEQYGICEVRTEYRPADSYGYLPLPYHLMHKSMKKIAQVIYVE